MPKVDIEYINYEENIHKKFPKIKFCKVFSKNKIINVKFIATNSINNISEDIGFDKEGKYYSISFGQWFNSKTEEFISDKDFVDLEESESYFYDHVSCLVKIHSEENYRFCFHNETDNIIVMSLIPYKILNFSDNDSDEILFDFRG